MPEDLLDYRQRYPDAPGYRDTDTSRAAAAAIAADLNAMQASVLAAIRAAGEAGMTMEEVAEVAGLGRHSAQPRTSELRLKGLIRDGGERRALASGRKGIVWVAA